MEFDVGAKLGFLSLALLCGLPMSPALAAGMAPTVDANASRVSEAAAISRSKSSCNTPPSVPSGLSSPKQRPTSIVLQWNASTSDANCTVSYRLLRDGGQSISTASASLTIKALLPDTDYRFAIVATNQFGSSSASAPINVRTSGGTRREPRRFAGDVVRRSVGAQARDIRFDRTCRTERLMSG
jgi:hypothetical protein